MWLLFFIVTSEWVISITENVWSHCHVLVTVVKAFAALVEKDQVLLDLVLNRGWTMPANSTLCCTRHTMQWCGWSAM